jgi:hypothetical protein
VFSPEGLVFAFNAFGCEVPKIALEFVPGLCQCGHCVACHEQKNSSRTSESGSSTSLVSADFQKIVARDRERAPGANAALIA